MRRDRLEQKVYTYINKEQMTAPGQRVLLAVSGGADSMAMLAIMYALAPALGIKLAVAHLDHGLRPCSWQDAELVEQTCAHYKLPFYSRVTDVAAYCEAKGLGIEAGAREVRYQWLREAAAAFGADRIATAHHRDDQAETILIHLIRGSGVKGLGGMTPVSGIYVRPLLECSKEELLSYVEHKSVPYREDESNQDINFLRNRVRHQLLPLLETEYNPAIKERLYVLGENARQDYDYLEAAASKVLSRRVSQIKPHTWELDLTAWKEEHPALQNQVLMQLLASIRGSDDYTRSDIEVLQSLTSSQGSAKRVRLAGGITARREYGKLVLTQRQEDPATASFTYRLSVPGQVLIRERGIQLTASREKPEMTPDQQIVILDAETCPADLEVRNRQRGDRIRLPGGTRKLSDWFIDQKIPVPQRDQRLLLAHGSQIIWIEDGTVALPFRPRPPHPCLWISLQRL